MLAANDLFYASAVLFLLLIPFVWLAEADDARQRGRIRRRRRRALSISRKRSPVTPSADVAGFRRLTLVAVQHRHLPQ